MSKAFGPQLPHLPSYDMGALRSDPSALRKAYHKALLAVHPDKQNDASTGAQAVAIELFHALSAARAKVAAAEASGVRLPSIYLYCGRGRPAAGSGGASGAAWLRCEEEP